MSWFGKKMKRARSDNPLDRGFELVTSDGNKSLPTQDTRSAIDELSQAVRNNPESVEIYLALGNLYRSQGEIERAVQIRNNLIVRPGLPLELKIRALFELGRDFRRGGFLDRAQDVYEEARTLSGDNPAIMFELARLYADVGEYERASRCWSSLNQPIAESHYLVRLAREKFEEENHSTGFKLLKKALNVSPASVEPWLELLIQTYSMKTVDRFHSTLRKALVEVPDSKRFVLLEGLLQFVRNGGGGSTSGSAPDEELSRAMLPILEEQPAEVLLLYYLASLHMLCRDICKARQKLEHALSLKPDFWLARLELLALSKSGQELTPEFSETLDFFIDKAHHVKRFVCRTCGLKRENIFFLCPRCQSWHSIGFRMNMT